MPNIVDINIRADDNTAAGFDSAEDRAKRFSDGVQNVLGGLKAFALAAGADIGASLAGPIVAAGGAAAAAYASAGAALGAFYAAAVPQLTEVSNVTDLYAKAQTAAAEGGEKAAKAQQAYEKALLKLPPATRATAIAMIGLKEDFKKWSDSLAPKTMPVFTKGIELLRKIIPQLTPLVEVGADALSDFIDELDRGVRNGSLKKIVDQLADAARETLPAFLRSAKNIVVGFGGIIGAFLPFSGQMAGGIENLTEKFADFGKSLGQNPQFQQWMQNMQAQGPGILELLGNLALIFVNIGQALAPFTGLTLAVAEALAKMVAAIPQETMDWLAPTIAGIVLAVKAWSIAQGLLNIALAANPIGLLVIAIGALAFGLYQAYQKSETFRDIVNGAFGAVKDVVLGVVDAVVPKLDGFGEGARKAWGVVEDAAQAVIDFIEPALIGLLQFFEDKVIPGIKSLGGAFTELGNFASAATDKIKGIGGGLDDYSDQLKKSEGDSRSFVERVSSAISSVARKIASLLSGTKENLQDWWNDSSRWLGRAFVKTFSKLPDSVQDAARDVRRTIRDLRDWISDAFSGASRWLGNAGVNLVYGLASGIYSVASWVTDALRYILPDFLEGYIPGFASGGIIGAAGGGPRSNLVMVGEQGRELVKLPIGSTVIPNGQTEAMMAGGGGGGAPQIIIQVQPSGGGLDNLFISWLRESIRDRGGDVAVVLGGG